MSNGQSTLYGAGTVKTAFGTATSAGDNLVVAAVSGKRIRVVAFLLSGPSGVTGTFEDNDGPISGGLSFPNVIIVPFLEVGWFQTKVGGRLDLNLSAASVIFYTVKYVEVD